MPGVMSPATDAYCIDGVAHAVYDTLLDAGTVGKEGTGHPFNDEHLHCLQLFASLASLILVRCVKTLEPRIPSGKGDENA